MIQENDSGGEPFKYIECFSATIQSVVYSGGRGTLWGGVRGARGLEGVQGGKMAASPRQRCIRFLNRPPQPPREGSAHLCIVLHFQRLICFMMPFTYSVVYRRSGLAKGEQSLLLMALICFIFVSIDVYFV